MSMRVGLAPQYAFGRHKIRSLYLLSTLDVIHMIKSTRLSPPNLQQEFKGYRFSHARKEGRVSGLQGSTIFRVSVYALALAARN